MVVALFRQMNGIHGTISSISFLVVSPQQLRRSVASAIAMQRSMSASTLADAVGRVRDADLRRHLLGEADERLVVGEVGADASPVEEVEEERERVRVVLAEAGRAVHLDLVRRGRRRR